MIRDFKPLRSNEMNMPVEPCPEEFIRRPRKAASLGELPSNDQFSYTKPSVIVESSKHTRLAVAAIEQGVYRLENPPLNSPGQMPDTPTAASGTTRKASYTPTNLIVSALTRDLWQDWLDRTRHDVFHTADYYRVEAEATGATAHLAVYGKPERFIAWPYLLKPISIGNSSVDPTCREVTCAYGYSGPLACQCQNDESFLKKAWEAISSEWAVQGAVSAFVRFHPILGNALWFQGGSKILDKTEPQGNLGFVGNTVAIDLSNTPDGIWYGYSRQVRQAVRRCLRSGMVIEEDLEWKYLEDFVRIYHKTMERNKADGFYFFPTQYLRTLREAVGQHVRLMAARYEDKVVSAALLMEYGGIVSLYLLATDDEYLHLSPSKALLHASQEWAKARGNHTFHLGGGRGGRSNEPLFHFKAAFSSQFFPFHVGRWVLNQPAYDFLTEKRRKETALFRDKEIDPDYFPAYRAPLIESTKLS
jgi:hypothetical protein